MDMFHPLRNEQNALDVQEMISNCGACLFVNVALVYEDNEHIPDKSDVLRGSFGAL